MSVLLSAVHRTHEYACHGVGVQTFLKSTKVEVFLVCKKTCIKDEAMTYICMYVKGMQCAAKDIAHHIINYSYIFQQGSPKINLALLLDVNTPN